MNTGLRYWFDGNHQPDHHLPVRVLVTDDVFHDPYSAHDRTLNHLVYMGFSYTVEMTYDADTRLERCLEVADAGSRFGENATDEWTTFYSYETKAVVFCFKSERDAMVFRLLSS